MTPLATIVLIVLIVIVILFSIKKKNATKNEATSVNVNYSVSSITDKQESLIRLAQIYHCSEENLEEAIVKKFSLDKISEKKSQSLLEGIRKSKMQEAKLLNINPEDTASAIVEMHMLKHIPNQIY